MEKAMKFKPLKLNGMNLSTGPRNTSGVGPEFYDPHLPMWHSDGSPWLVTYYDPLSDLELVKSAGHNAVRWGLLPRDVWGVHNGEPWSVEETRLRPMLEASAALGLRHIYPVWWRNEEERVLTMERLLPILAEYPHVIPQFGPNEWMDPAGWPEGSDYEREWAKARAQVDEMAAWWRVHAPGRPWIAPQVCPLQDGSLRIDWRSLRLHAEAWPDAYLAVALYGEDGVPIPGLPGVGSDVEDLRFLLVEYDNRLIVTEHGRSRAEFRAEWKRQAHEAIKASGDGDLLNAAPMPAWSGCRYLWRYVGPPNPRLERFSQQTAVLIQAVEA